MTGTALNTNEILQYLVLDKIVIAFFPELVMSTDLLSFEHPSVLLFCLLQKHLIKFVLISTWLFVINMRICDVLLNSFVSVYMPIFT